MSNPACQPPLRTIHVITALSLAQHALPAVPASFLSLLSTDRLYTLASASAQQVQSQACRRMERRPGLQGWTPYSGEGSAYMCAGECLRVQA